MLILLGCSVGAETPASQHPRWNIVAGRSKTDLAATVLWLDSFGRDADLPVISRANGETLPPSTQSFSNRKCNDGDTRKCSKLLILSRMLSYGRRVTPIPQATKGKVFDRYSTRCPRLDICPLR